MLRLTLKGLWAHKLRYALTGLAVVLGVAFMAGTMVLTDTMQKTFDDVFETANAGTDVLVRRAAAIDGDFTGARPRVDAAVVDQVAAVEGVDTARGSITGLTQLVHADGEVSATDGLGATIGANWIDDERLNPFSLATGRVPAGAGEAVMDVATARDQGWQLGDRFTVLTLAGPAELTLVGTAGYGDVDGLPGSTLVATDDATAQALFGEPGRYDVVVVAADGGVRAADLGARIGAEVATPGSGLESLTGEEDTADRQADLQEDLSFFNQFLMAFAYVALFVGMFIIYNTFSIVVAQRSRDMAMLRAIGARRAQVLRSIVLESVGVGLVAAAIGLVAGVGLSFGLRALLDGVGLEIPSGPVVVSQRTIATAFAVGLVATVVSAVVPAARASRVKPVAALREVAVDRSDLSTGRVVAGLLLCAGGVASFAAGSAADGDAALPLIGLGAMVVIVGMCTLGPVLIGPAIRVLGAPLGAAGVTGRYARENARRNPRRTSSTAAALMIGVALVGFITILAASTDASVEAAVDRSFRADFVVDSGSFTQGFATTIEDDLRAAPVVEELSPLRTTPAEVDGSTTDLVAVDTATIDRLYDLEVTAGSMADVSGDGIAAGGDDAALGDEVPVRFPDGSESVLEVRAVYAGTIEGGGDSGWIVGLDTFEAHVADQLDRKVFVATASGVDAATARAQVDEAVAGWANAEIQDQADFKQSITEQIDTMLNLIYGLLALAVVIALIGIANTLALSVHERTRELGVLRAVGMKRSQLRQAVRAESVLISVLGALLGGVLALGGAWGIVQALDGDGVTRLAIPTTQLAVILGMAAVAGVLAAAGPARRAARLNVLRAIASE
jgi:putative ABC transport system permease protein